MCMCLLVQGGGGLCACACLCKEETGCVRRVPAHACGCLLVQGMEGGSHVLACSRGGWPSHDLPAKTPMVKHTTATTRMSAKALCSRLPPAAGFLAAGRDLTVNMFEAAGVDLAG